MEEIITASDVPSVIFRCNHVFGPPDAPGPTASAFLAKRGSVRILGNGRQRLAPIFRDDVADALVSAALDVDTPTGTFQLAGPETMTAADFARKLAGGRVRIRRTSKPFARVPGPHSVRAQPDARQPHAQGRRPADLGARDREPLRRDAAHGGRRLGRRRRLGGEGAAAPGAYAARVSISVELEQLREQIAELPALTYLVTVSADGRPHSVAVVPQWRDDELATAPGNTSVRNAWERPLVTLLWPPAEPGGYSLIVDGTVTRAEGAGTGDNSVVVRPTKAVLHRPAVSPDDASPGCGSDCVPLLRD